MSNLEKHIRQQSMAFDDAMPSEGHLNRFEEKLNQQPKKGLNIPLIKHTLQIAASLLLLFGISYTFFNGYHHLIRQGKTISQAILPADLTEVKTYYTMQADQQLKTIEQSSGSQQVEELKSLARTQTNTLLQSTQQLEQQYAKQNQDERVYGAIVSNYRILTKVLGNILTKIEQENNQINQQQKTLNHENANL